MSTRFKKTGGYRLGVVMLGKDLSKEFKDDVARFEALYKMGYRAFQVLLLFCSDQYLIDLRAWADAQEEDIEISALLAFIEDGAGGSCPISAASSKRDLAKEQVKITFTKAKLVRATGIHGPLFQGLINSHLNDIPRADQEAFLIEFIQFVDALAIAANMPVGWEVLNMHEYPAPGPTTLRRAERIFLKAGASPLMRYLLDPCHQSQGEASTVEAWEKYGARASCIHLSDTGRTLLGREQALPLELFRFLLKAQLPVTLYVEAIGRDATDFIKMALHVNDVPDLDGEDVLQAAVVFVEDMFAKAA